MDNGYSCQRNWKCLWNWVLQTHWAPLKQCEPHRPPHPPRLQCSQWPWDLRQVQLSYPGEQLVLFNILQDKRHSEIAGSLMTRDTARLPEGWPFFQKISKCTKMDYPRKNLDFLQFISFRRRDVLGSAEWSHHPSTGKGFDSAGRSLIPCEVLFTKIGRRNKWEQCKKENPKG